MLLHGQTESCRPLQQVAQFRLQGLDLLFFMTLRVMMEAPIMAMG